MLMEELEDSWLLPPAPGKRQRGVVHTFHTRVAAADGSLSYTSARLDRWLTPVALREWVMDTVIHPLRDDFLPGDHGAVVLDLSPPSQPPRGPGVWTCPLAVLNDDAFKDALELHVATFQQQHQGLGARDLWEAVKLAIADYTQAYCIGQPGASARRSDAAPHGGACARGLPGPARVLLSCCRAAPRSLCPLGGLACQAGRRRPPGRGRLVAGLRGAGVLLVPPHGCHGPPAGAALLRYLCRGPSTFLFRPAAGGA